ncbi:MAG: hypothetical protein RL553_511 [Planctomycetota bacterium]|jgi:formylglycine-generating enzyme required for sulfatase activity
MKRILGIVMVFGFVGALSVMAQEVKPGKVDVIELGKGVKLEMVLIPAGKFMMGSKVDPFSNIQPYEDELPQHEVTLKKPFYMGKYEVTQEQWFEIMGENPSEEKGRKLPVTDVSWKDCQEFIKKLNAKTDGGYRLPTEAEWEYSCRAGTTTSYSFGGSLATSDANFIDSDDTVKDGERGRAKAVGGYKPNAFGLYDMHGNVWEWCEDWYAKYSDGAVMDPKGPVTGKGRVCRGGSFLNYAKYARSSFRNVDTPTNWGYRGGFRLARTADFKQEKEAKAKQMELVNLSIEKEMVLIPAGKFKMGSPESEKGRSKAETQHEVTLTKPFYMGKYEVTQEQWNALMGNNPSATKGAKLPVTRVSWEDCQEFIKKLNPKTNGGYRLPTEAEWEFACRAGTATAYSFGDNLTKSDANIYGDSTKAVGSYRPNAFGLYDMHGNVFELCEDWHGDYPDGAVMDPKGPVTGEDRVLRGGSFDNIVSNARSSSRLTYTTTNRFLTYGFRLARTK